MLVTILYIGLSKTSCLTTLRLFHDYLSGETTTIGYDYSRSCYDYFSRNAATIARPYWLSGESPKRDTAVAVNGSAPPAAPPCRRTAPPGRGRTLTADRCQTSSHRTWEASRPRRAVMVCDMLHCLAWIHNRGAPLHPYIPYYNRAAALPCTASGVAVVSGMRWRCCGAVMCSNVAQAVL